jgi:hypothetical protein
MNQSLPLETKSSNQASAQPPPSAAEIDPESEKDENLPWPPNISLCTTSQLAYLFNKLCDEEDSKVSSNQREIVKQVALQILSTPIDRQTLFQLPALAIMKDDDILKELMQVLVKKISDETFIAPNTLRALSQVVYFKLQKSLAFQTDQEMRTAGFCDTPKQKKKWRRWRQRTGCLIVVV